ncbi:SAM-dependent methyltransferase [Microbacterium sp. USHLN186]|uniref:SAM-dependent methyltransferase n=1 Tax=Microbacterium sp. USHLN186 TaxID=3081286 RepID=UPI003017DF85
MHPALFYRPGERLSLPELSAARLDGDVVEVGDGYMPADTVEEPAARAFSLARLAPAGTALSGASAAWVHGAGDQPPAVHHITRISASRQRVEFSTRVVHHERCLAVEDVQMVGGVRVATAVSTAASLLFSSARASEDERWLRALIAVTPGLAGDLRRRVTDPVRRPGAQHARRLLGELCAPPDALDGAPDGARDGRPPRARCVVRRS